MQKSVKKIGLSLAVVSALSFGLVGCGGGGGGGSSSGESETPSTDITTEETYTGYLVDSNVSGVSYDDGLNSGITDERGAFTFSKNRTLSFSIGGINLGNTDTSSILENNTVYITNIIENIDRNNTSDTKVVKLLQFLQSLDSDNNTSNGIDIDEATQTALGSYVYDIQNESVTTQDITTIIESIGKTVVPQDEAIKHFKNTLIDANLLINHIPVFTSENTLNVSENQTSALTLMATDENNDTLTYSLNGTDADSFNINSNTGVVTFVNAPDFETKTSYTFIATVSDGTNSVEETISVNISDVDEYIAYSPVFISSNTVSVKENQTSALTLMATDGNNDTLTYSLSGTDESSFSIDSSTGVVRFKSSPNYESKKVYTFTASVSDGASTVTQEVTINITDVNEYIAPPPAPVIISDTTAPTLSSTTQTYTTTVGTALTLQTVTATDDTDGTVSVTQSGTVDFNSAGTYAVTYTATDSSSNTSTITHTYTVNAVVIVSDTTAPTLSSTTQTYTTTVGTALTLQTVTATDDTDSSVSVVQSGDTVDFNSAGTYAVTYTATDSASNTATITHTYTVNVAVAATTITHNGITYETVTSPYTSKVWLDRNLGASQVCTTFDDSACYGDYYQWGRETDGHQLSSSTTTATQATAITSVGSDFITNSTSPYDWTSVDSNGSQRTSNWSAIDGSSVCPIGYRVPTITELEAETTGASTAVTNNATAFSNFLKLPSAGSRGGNSGSMYTLGSHGSYSSVWSSSVSGSDSRNVYFASNGAFSNNNTRAHGWSVRCLRD